MRVFILLLLLLTASTWAQEVVLDLVDTKPTQAFLREGLNVIADTQSGRLCGRFKLGVYAYEFQARLKGAWPDVLYVDQNRDHDWNDEKAVPAEQLQAAVRFLVPNLTAKYRDDQGFLSLPMRVALTFSKRHNDWRAYVSICTAYQGQLSVPPFTIVWLPDQPAYFQTPLRALYRKVNIVYHGPEQVTITRVVHRNGRRIAICRKSPRQDLVAVPAPAGLYCLVLNKRGAFGYYDEISLPRDGRVWFYRDCYMRLGFRKQHAGVAYEALIVQSMRDIVHHRPMSVVALEPLRLRLSINHRQGNVLAIQPSLVNPSNNQVYLYQDGQLLPPPCLTIKGPNGDVLTRHNYKYG